MSKDTREENRRVRNTRTLGVFIDATRGKSRKEIEQKQQKLGRALTREERRKIMNKNAKTLKVRIACVATGTVLFLGGAFVGHNSTKMLYSASGIEKQEDGISVDMDKLDGDLNVSNYTNEHKIFVDGMKVDINEVGINEDVTENIEKEINNLSNSNEVLDYIKQIYVDEYNSKYDTNITIDDITLNKSRETAVHLKELENGDKVLVLGHSEDEKDVDTSTGVEKVSINLDGEILSEATMKSDAYSEGQYENIYKSDEEATEKKEDLVITELGAIVSNGIDYYSSFLDKDESETYKQRLIDSVVTYKESKQESKSNKIIQGEDKKTEEPEIEQ